MTERQNHEERMENQEYSMSGRETRDQQAAATAAEQHILNEPHCGHCGGTGVAQEAAIPLPGPDGSCEPCQGTGERQEDIPVTTSDDQIYDPDTHLSYEVDPPEAVTRATGIILKFDTDGTYQRIEQTGPLGLALMQKLVDGMIERVSTPSFDLWVNEEGLMRDDFDNNIGASYLLGKHGAPNTIILGPAFIAASDDDGEAVPAPTEVIDICLASLHQLGYTQVEPPLKPIAGGSGEAPEGTADVTISAEILVKVPLRRGERAALPASGAASGEVWSRIVESAYARLSIQIDGVHQPAADIYWGAANVVASPPPIAGGAAITLPPDVSMDQVLALV